MFSHGQILSLSVSGTVWTVAFFVDRITTGDLLVVIGAIIFGLATWRSATRKTLAEDNAALRGRVETLEAECHALTEEKTKLLAQMVAEQTEQQRIRHDLKDQIVALKLATDLTSHEAREVSRHEEIVSTLEGIKTVLGEMVAQLQRS